MEGVNWHWHDDQLTIRIESVGIMDSVMIEELLRPPEGR